MKKKILLVIIILLIILLIILGIFIKNNDKKIQTEIPLNTEKNEIARVENASAFFTVENCINKYLSYLYNKDTEIIFNLLDESYKKELDINKENVLKYVENLNGIYIFEAKDMYYEKNGNIQKYYVTGQITGDGLVEVVSEESSERFNITVILDMNNNTFTVIPYGYGGMYYEEKYN